MNTLRVTTAYLALAILGAARLAAQPPAPTLTDLLDRAAGYVQAFVADFSNVVAVEDFRQDWQSGERRRLTSDFLLVRYPGAESTWLAFRDVIAVNGREVRDQQQRVTRLFLDPFADAVRRAEEITREGSRHSLVELGPLSSPFVVLAWLQPFYRADFRFRLGGSDTRDGVRLRVVELEQIVPLPVSAATQRVIPIEALAWVDERTGRVARTEVRQGLAPNTAIISVTFKRDPVLGIDVPAEMRDSRTRPAVSRALITAGREQFTGIATYSGFRRFQVRTEEDIDTPPPQ